MSTLLIAIGVIAGFGLIFGLILGFAALHFKIKDDPIVEKIDQLLPQSQCGQCGYPGCRPYAEAITNSGETINKCAPGGEQAMLKIAELLNMEPQALDEDKLTPERKVAFIDEANCIGCTKCIQACPVDAIVGTTRAMHTVVKDLCTGCDLCVAPCPTDCITMLPIKTTIKNWKWDLTTIPVKNITTPSSSTPTVAFASKEQANV
ncbi:MAG: electron transport complex subunit RsxB [Candidatus Phlomobacter fragariae]